MTDVEILKSAIEKAGENGSAAMSEFVLNTINWEWFIENSSYYKIIFSHEFAKAFWGEGFRDGRRIMQSDGSSNTGEDWEHYLQIMVLEGNPIKYLEQFL